MEKSTSDASDSASSPPITAREPGMIQHMPRQRAKPPMLPQTESALKRTGPVPDPKAVALSREQVSKAYDILEERRLGPYFVKYGIIGSVGLIAYTYLQGFYHLTQKNREAWVGTFRHRTLILGPIIAMYATANDVIPLPYKERVEAALGRGAITMYDIVTAEQTVRKSKELPLSAQA